MMYDLCMRYVIRSMFVHICIYVCIIYVYIQRSLYLLLSLFLVLLFSLFLGTIIFEFLLYPCSIITKDRFNNRYQRKFDSIFFLDYSMGTKNIILSLAFSFFFFLCFFSIFVSLFLTIRI